MQEPLLDGAAPIEFAASAAAEKRNWKEEVPKPHLCPCLPFDIFPKLLLMSIALLTFGSYWCYDQPGAIKSKLTEWFGPSYSNKKNLLFYSVYSFPNTVLCLFGGFIVDRITGVRGGVVLFTLLVLLGQTVFALGIASKEYYVALFGRFLYGLGGENLVVAQNTFTVRWFSGKTLALAFGTVVAFARVGTSVNFAVSPRLARNGIKSAIWTSTGMTGLSFLMAMVAATLDWKGEERRQGVAAIVKRQADEEAGLLDAPANGAVQEDSAGVESEEGQVKLSDIKKFPMSAWILFFMCLLMYVSIMTFYSVASDILQNTGKKYNEDTASMFLSIPNFMAIPFCPLFGRLQDVYGRALNLISITFVGLICGHVVFLLMAYETISLPPPVIMVWIGLCYSLGSSQIWPVLARIIDSRMLGTGYGAMTSVQNCGLALFPLLIGVIQDDKDIEGRTLQYTLPIFIFIGCSLVGLLLTFWLIRVDRVRHNGKMNAPAVGNRGAAATDSEVISIDDSGAVYTQGTDAQTIRRPSFSDAYEKDPDADMTNAGSLSVSYERRSVFGM